MKNSFARFRFQVSGFILVCAMLALTGCCNTYMVSQHNNRVETARLLKFQAANNGMTLGVDLLNLDVKGYLASWKEDPWGMTAATIGDAAVAFGGYKLYQAATDNSESSASTATPTIQTSGGDVYIISGTGNSIERTNTETK